MNLFALVKASPDCVRLLGSNPMRFFEFGQAPQLETTPYATHQHIAGTPYNQLCGPAVADHVTTQIDVWADTASDCKAIARAIRAALEGHCYVTSWLGTGKEGDYYRATFSVQFIELA